MSLEGFSGSSGIKYGLNLRGVQKKGPAVAAKPKLPVANAFQVDSDDVRTTSDIEYLYFYSSACLLSSS